MPQRHDFGQVAACTAVTCIELAEQAVIGGLKLDRAGLDGLEHDQAGIDGVDSGYRINSVGLRDGAGVLMVVPMHPVRARRVGTAEEGSLRLLGCSPLRVR